MTRLSVVTVTYNNANNIEQFIRTLKKGLEKIKSEVWLIDNNSPDLTAKIINTYKEFHVIINKRNLGFGKANNQALRKVHSPYILLLNPDSELLPTTIPYLLDFMEKNMKVGLVTCRVEKEDGSLDRACRRGFPTPWRSICRMTYLDKIFPNSRLFGGYNLTYLSENKISEIDSAVGAFMLIRKEALDEAGIFDEDYFMYGEDIDLCYRIKEKGWKVIYNPRVKILHHKGVSSGILRHSAKKSQSSIKHRAAMIGHFHKSMHIFYYKHYRNKYPWILNKLVMVGINLKMYLALSRLYVLGY